MSRIWFSCLPGHLPTAYILPGAVDRALDLLHTEDPESLDRASAVESPIEGFETPFGLELLPTVHWVMIEIPACREDLTTTIAQVHSWNPRKAEIFNRDQIEMAWPQLRAKGWAA